MYLFLNDGVANKKYRYELSNFIRTDIGYRQHYILFTKMDCMVTPQPYIRIQFIRKSRKSYFFAF